MEQQAIVQALQSTLAHIGDQVGVKVEAGVEIKDQQIFIVQNIHVHSAESDFTPLDVYAAQNQLSKHQATDWLNRNPQFEAFPQLAETLTNTGRGLKTKVRKSNKRRTRYVNLRLVRQILDHSKLFQTSIY